MSECNDCDNEDVVVDRVDDAVVTDANPEAGTTLESFGTWWPRVLAKKSDGPTNAVAILMIYSLQRANCSGTQFDLIGHVQPRSAFT
jgi:hypothetical protein